MRRAKYLGIFLVTLLANACGENEEGGETSGGNGGAGGGAHAGAGGKAISSGGASGTGTMGQSGADAGGRAGGALGGGAGTNGARGGSAGAQTGGMSGNGGKPSGAGASGGKPSGGGAGDEAGDAGHDGSSGASSETCDAPPDPSTLAGWASVSGNGVSTTTGGGTATPTIVTTLSDFTNAVKGTNAAVIYVKGTLAAGKVSVGSNKTIAGICGATIHGHLELSGSVNVIVRNLTIVGYGVGDCSLDPDYDAGTGCSSGNDAVTVQKNAHHVWFDHCDISDGTDGNLDITNAANYVTVSWPKFHYTARTDDDGSDSTGDAGHRFSSLVGGTDSPSTYDDADALNVTWHHDYWADNVVERQPRVRFGKNHLYNNLWAATGDNYCVRAGTHAAILIENSAFANVKDPHQFNSTDDEATANIAATGNDYSTATGKEDTGGGGPPIGTLPYSYTPDALDTVSAAVKDGAGPH
jgi:pectate lyase